MSGQYPITPSPISSQKMSCLQILKTSSNRIMYALLFLFYKPLNKIFFTETTISNTEVFYVLRDFCNSKPSNISTSQSFFSIYILGHQIHGRTPYRRQVALHSHLSPIRIIYLFICLSSERVYHSTKLEKRRDDLSLYFHSFQTDTLSLSRVPSSMSLLLITNL